jgi:DNA-binding transcriptional regulator YiaG
VENQHKVTVQLRSGPLSIIVTGIPAMKCRACGEGFSGIIDLVRADLAAAVELANRGLKDGGAFRFLRKALGVSGEKLAQLLDVTEWTISRWENGHAPVDRSAWAALAAMVSEKLAGQTTTLDRLRASIAPKATNRPLRLRLAHG